MTRAVKWEYDAMAICELCDARGTPSNKVLIGTSGNVPWISLCKNCIAKAWDAIEDLEDAAV